MRDSDHFVLTHAILAAVVLLVFFMRRWLRWFWQRLWTRPNDDWHDEP